jgi:hypothetical protein
VAEREVENRTGYTHSISPRIAFLLTTSMIVLLLAYVLYIFHEIQTSGPRN